ncbi:hypothetical protein [Aeromonas enteropelogenes]|uniref:hypothetical protein n=1 Tax=Aeromonas enteropelogenes TaxID=29489 RepID=UPI003BA2BB6A
MFDELKVSLKEAIEIKLGHIEPIAQTKYEAADVQAIRLNLKVSKLAFAEAKRVSADTD